MNAHSQKSFDIASYLSEGQARRRRLMSPPNDLELNRVIFVHVRPDADHHVGAWKAWQRINDPATIPADFIRAHCRVAGVAYSDLVRRRGRVAHWLFKPLLQAVTDRYPSLSCTKLGQLFKKHHTTILYTFGRTSSAKRRLAA